MAKKREIQYVLDGYVNSRLYKALGSVQKGLGRTQNSLKGLNRLQAQSNAIARRAGVGQSWFGSGLARTALGAAAAYISIQSLTAAYRSLSEAGNAQIRAETRVQQIMTNLGAKGRGYTEVLKKQARALQQVTTVGDEVTLYGASQLGTFQLQGKNLTALVPSLQNLAVAQYGVNVTQEEMFQSANQLGKVFTGQVGSMKRMGISFSKAQEKILKTGTESQKTATLIQVINDNYGNLARRMAKTPEGRIMRLRNAWGDIRETLYFKVLPVQEKVINYLSDHLPQIQALLQKGITTLGKAGPPLKAIWKLVYGIGSYTVKNWSWLGPIIKGIVAALIVWRTVTMALSIAQLALNVALTANPIGLVIVAIGLLIGGIVALVKNWDKVILALGRAWKWFVKFGTEGAGRFIPIVAVVALIARHWDKIVSVLKVAWNWMKKIAGIIFKGSPVGMAISAYQKIKGRAAGGPVYAGRPYVVGEAGPELFYPKQRGAIAPSGMALAGAGPTYNVTINVQGGPPAQAREAGRQAGLGFVEQLKRYERDRKRRSFRD